MANGEWRMAKGSLKPSLVTRHPSLGFDSYRVSQLTRPRDVIPRKRLELRRRAVRGFRAKRGEPLAGVGQGQDARHLLRHALPYRERGAGGCEHAEPVVALVWHARLLEAGDA